MSNISKLIEELCPDGVEFKPLENFLDYAQPSKYIVSHTNYSNDFKTPVLTPGKTFILGYTDDIDGIFDASDECPVILFDDFTTSFRWIDFKFKVKSSAVKILSSKDSEVSFKYIYYAMKTIRYETLDHSRQWISNYSKIKIPVPPLGVQEEIVRILDRFTLLEAELEAELEARKKQYAFYRNFIVTEHYDKYPLEKIENLCSFLNGKAHEKFEDEFGSAVLVTAGFISSSGVKKRCISTENIQSPLKDRSVCIVMSDLPNGKALAKAAYISDGSGFALNQRVCALNSLDESKLKPRYLYYFMNRNRQLLKYDSKQYQTHLKKDYFMRVKIPVPPLEEQQRIVDILDRFDALVNDISSGLPAEIAARRKQYEHYRDQLLTFKEREPADS